eukprot:1144733-Pelagomonas_calceolata.AAC.10
MRALTPPPVLLCLQQPAGPRPPAPAVQLQPAARSLRTAGRPPPRGRQTAAAAAPAAQAGGSAQHSTQKVRGQEGCDLGG